MEKIKFIYADLQKPGDKDNSIALTTHGTMTDIERYNIKFEEGKSYWFWRDSSENNPLIFNAIVRFNKELQIWIADYDPKSIKHLSESEFAKEYTAKDIEGA